jgi:hypothetical protein
MARKGNYKVFRKDRPFRDMAEEKMGENNEMDEEKTEENDPEVIVIEDPLESEETAEPEVIIIDDNSDLEKVNEPLVNIEEGDLEQGEVMEPVHEYTIGEMFWLRAAHLTPSFGELLYNREMMGLEMEGPHIASNLFTDPLFDSERWYGFRGY